MRSRLPTLRTRSGSQSDPGVVCDISTVHDEGIPKRSEWPSGVVEAVAQLRQGDLVPGLPLFYWANPEAPVHARTRHYRDSGVIDEGIVEFAEVAPYGMITTQTCDLAQEGDRKPNSAWAQLAPVFNALAHHPASPDRNLLDGGKRKLIQQGRDQFRLWVPKVPAEGFWFADLTFEVPVERGWLARRAVIDGFGDETAREEVGRRLAWLRSRPAFDTKFVAAVQAPTIDGLRQLAGTDARLYERMHTQVVEVGVLLNGRLNVGQAELVILHTGIDPDVEQWWLKLWDSLKRRADEVGFNLLPLRCADLGELPAGEYRRMTRMPLAAISPHPACYGEAPEELPDPK